MLGPQLDIPELLRRRGIARGLDDELHGVIIYLRKLLRRFHRLAQLFHRCLFLIIDRHLFNRVLAAAGRKSLVKIIMEVHAVPVEGIALNHLDQIIGGVHHLAGGLMHLNILIRRLRHIQKGLGQPKGRIDQKPGYNQSDNDEDGMNKPQGNPFGLELLLERHGHHLRFSDG